MRVYAFPQDDIPKVEWTATPRNSVANYGDTLAFSVEASPNETTQSPVETVYLFDSGYLVAYKTAPPYEFLVHLNREFYDTTDYNRPGRQGLVPEFDKTYHAYSVFVQDAAGKVAHTPVWTLDYIRKPETPASTPYHGKPQTIPGRIQLKDYDEGGQGIAYLDTTPGNSFSERNPNASPRAEDVDVNGNTIGYVDGGEWLNYTVDIETAGTYQATLPYGTPSKGPFDVKLFLDDRETAVFSLTSQGARGHEINKQTTATLELPEGRHVLKVLFLARPNVQYIDFERQP